MLDNNTTSLSLSLVDSETGSSLNKELSPAIENSNEEPVERISTNEIGNEIALENASVSEFTNLKTSDQHEQPVKINLQQISVSPVDKNDASGHQSNPQTSDVKSTTNAYVSMETDVNNNNNSNDNNIVFDSETTSLRIHENDDDTPTNFLNTEVLDHNNNISPTITDEILMTRVPTIDLNDVSDVLETTHEHKKDSFLDILVQPRTIKNDEYIDDLEAELAQFTEELQHKKEEPMELSSDEDEETNLVTSNNKKKSKEATVYESEFLARRIMEGKESESYLKSKLAESEHKLEMSQIKVKDLQLRLIRFTKDHHAKDKRVASLEKEIRETNIRIEEMINEKVNTIDKNPQHQTRITSKESKTCAIL